MSPPSPVLLYFLYCLIPQPDFSCYESLTCYYRCCTTETSTVILLPREPIRSCLPRQLFIIRVFLFGGESHPALSATIILTINVAKHFLRSSYPTHFGSLASQLQPLSSLLSRRNSPKLTSRTNISSKDYPPNQQQVPTLSSMPSQITQPIAPVPRRRLFITNTSFCQDDLTFELNSKVKTPYEFINRIHEHEYQAPPPPPPSPVNFPMESWSTACRR